MIDDGGLLLSIVLSSFFTGVVIFFLAEENHRLRTWLNFIGAGAKLVFVALMLQGVYRGVPFGFRYDLAPALTFRLNADPNAVFFVTLSTVLWFLTTLYAVGYLEHSPHRSRFFGFFSMCVSATTGVALAGNLFTFLMFYELLTLSTYPLVVHLSLQTGWDADRLDLGRVGITPRPDRWCADEARDPVLFERAYRRSVR